jgi:hypothetical protein
MGLWQGSPAAGGIGDNLPMLGSIALSFVGSFNHIDAAMRLTDGQ